MNGAAGTVRRSGILLRLADGRDLAFTEYGDPDGAPVFGFHGTPGSRQQLAPADGAAQDVGVRLIAPDRPGYGHSDFAPGRRLLDWPRDVEAVADHLDLDRFGVLGVSGGGPHALACAAGIPDRITCVGLVSSVAPLSTVAASDSTESFLRRAIPILRSPALTRPPVGALVAAMRRSPAFMIRVAARRTRSPRDRAVMLDPQQQALFADSARRASRTTARAAAQDLALFARPWDIDLSRIAPRVQLWHGDDDPLVEPLHAMVLARAIPDAALSLQPGEGHLMFVDHMTDILAALR